MKFLLMRMRIALNNEISFDENEDSFFVIDGQHRLYGAEYAENEIKIPVYIFNNLNIPEFIFFKDCFVYYHNI